jgi:hypothetical protein
MLGLQRLRRISRNQCSVSLAVAALQPPTTLHPEAHALPIVVVAAAVAIVVAAAAGGVFGLQREKEIEIEIEIEIDR